MKQPLSPSSESWELALPTRRSTLHLAQRLAPHLRTGDLLVLAGPLGAGKTFFVRGLARALGLPSSQPVTSPTFALVQELETHPVSLVHADLYRINHAAELMELGLLHARENNCLVVEWGAKYFDALGGDALFLELTRPPRRALLSASGPRSRELLEAVRAHPAKPSTKHL